MIRLNALGKPGVHINFSHISQKNIYCGYLKEAPQRYNNVFFLWRNIYYHNVWLKPVPLSKTFNQGSLLALANLLNAG